MNADLKSLERQLHSEGFLHTYVWQDGPNVHYPDHRHASETAHIILDGEMALTQVVRHTPMARASVATSLPAQCIPPAWAPTAAATSSAKNRFRISPENLRWAAFFSSTRAREMEIIAAVATIGFGSAGATWLRWRLSFNHVAARK